MADFPRLNMYMVQATARKTGPSILTPHLHLSLLVWAPIGSVRGQVVENQGLKTLASAVRGHILELDLDKYTRIVTLHGTKPTHFSGAFAIGGNWTGVGSWTMGDHTVDNVPIYPDHKAKLIGPVGVLPPARSAEAAVGRHITFAVGGNVWEWTIASSDEAVVGELSPGHRDDSAQFYPGAKALKAGTAVVTLKNSAGLPTWVVEVKVTE